MNRIVIASVLVAAVRTAHADTAPATAEWTWWLGLGTGVADRPDEDRAWVFGFRAGAAIDFEVLQIKNPWHYGGAFEIRWGPWLSGETRSDTHTIQGGLSIDFGQVRHASFGTYTIRGGAGFDIDGRPLASFTFLGGVRYVPDRNRGRQTFARASGGRIFGTLTTDFDGRSSLFVGIEFEPTWILPPYSLYKLGGVTH